MKYLFLAILVSGSFSVSVFAENQASNSANLPPHVQIGDKVYFINQDHKVYWMNPNGKESYQVKNLLETADGKDLAAYKGQLLLLQGKMPGEKRDYQLANFHSSGEINMRHGDEWRALGFNVQQMVASKKAILGLKDNGEVFDYTQRADDIMKNGFSLSNSIASSIGIKNVAKIQKKMLPNGEEDVEISTKDGKTILYSEIQAANLTKTLAALQDSNVAVQRPGEIESVGARKTSPFVTEAVIESAPAAVNLKADAAAE